MEAYQQRPWWWATIFRLLKRFENIRSWAALSKDSLPPPREIWMDDQALEAWRDDMKARRKNRDYDEQ